MRASQQLQLNTHGHLDPITANIYGSPEPSRSEVFLRQQQITSAACMHIHQSAGFSASCLYATNFGELRKSAFLGTLDTAFARLI